MDLTPPPSPSMSSSSSSSSFPTEAELVRMMINGDLTLEVFMSLYDQCPSLKDERDSWAYDKDQVRKNAYDLGKFSGFFNERLSGPLAETVDRKVLMDKLNKCFFECNGTIHYIQMGGDGTPSFKSFDPRAKSGNNPISRSIWVKVDKKKDEAGSTVTIHTREEKGAKKYNILHWWCEQPDHIKVAEITFDPGRRFGLVPYDAMQSDVHPDRIARIPKNIFQAANTFIPTQYATLDRNINIFLDSADRATLERTFQIYIYHLAHVICNADPKRIAYLLSWILRVRCEPERKTQVMVVIGGEAGCGKSIFVNTIAKCFGKMCMQNPRDANILVEKFNSMINRFPLLAFEELFFDKREPGTLSALKRRITQDKAHQERKYAEASEPVENIINILGSTQDFNKTFGDIMDDGLLRRTFCIQVNNAAKAQAEAERKKYFDEFANLTQSPDGLRLVDLFHVLLYRMGFFDKFNPNQIPHSADMSRLLLEGLDPEPKWWIKTYLVHKRSPFIKISKATEPREKDPDHGIEIACTANEMLAMYRSCVPVNSRSWPTETTDVDLFRVVNRYLIDPYEPDPDTPVFDLKQPDVLVTLPTVRNAIRFASRITSIPEECFDEFSSTIPSRKRKKKFSKTSSNSANNKGQKTMDSFFGKK